MKQFWRFFLIGIIFIFTFPLVGELIQPGVDYSYYFAYNYFFVHGLSHYHAIFSYGPLGFLFFPQPIENNLALGLVFWGVLHLIFATQLFLISHTGRSIGERITNGILIFFLCNVIDNWYVPIVSLALALVQYRKRGKKMWLAYAALLFAVTSLIKVTYLATGILIYGGFILAENICGGVWSYTPTRRGVFVSFFGGGVLTYILWVILVGFHGFGDFLRGYWEITKGDSGIMALSPVNNWWLLGGCLVLFFSSAFLERKQWFLYIFFLPVLFSMWKYTFTREDPTHLRYFFDFLIVFYGIVVLEGWERSRRRKKWMRHGLMIGSLVVFGWHMQILPLVGNPRFLRETVKKVIVPTKKGNFLRTAIRYRSYVAYLEGMSKPELARDQLSATVRRLIGEASVDVYPWEASIVAANELNWQYRPVLQSYASFTPWLDRQNKEFFESDQAPQYLLWQKAEKEYPYRLHDEEGIDGRYLLNDEPQTALAIQQEYEPVSEDERVIVLRRRITKRELHTQNISFRIDQKQPWITLPEVNDQRMILATFKQQRSLIREFQTIIWKEAPVFIEYRFKNGEMKRYKTSSSALATGIWVSPWYPAYPSLTSSRNVNAVRVIVK